MRLDRVRNAKGGRPLSRCLYGSNCAESSRSAKLARMLVMIYAAACFWVLLVVFLAWGVDKLWRGLAHPKTLRMLLWPGSFLAQIGRILALLITGAKVVKASPDESDSATGGADWAPKMPVIGPMVVAIIPMCLLAAVLYLVSQRLGYPVLEKLPATTVATVPPLTLPAFWDQLRSLITLSQGTLDAVRNADVQPWKLLLFMYLMVCFTVRMAPSPGNLRGHVSAIILIGIAAGLAGTVLEDLPKLIQGAWPILALALGWLLLLLIGTLIVRAVISSARVILKAE